MREWCMRLNEAIKYLNSELMLRKLNRFECDDRFVADVRISNCSRDEADSFMDLDLFGKKCNSLVGTFEIWSNQKLSSWSTLSFLVHIVCHIVPASPQNNSSIERLSAKHNEIVIYVWFKLNNEFSTDLLRHHRYWRNCWSTFLRTQWSCVRPTERKPETNVHGSNWMQMKWLFYYFDGFCFSLIFFYLFSLPIDGGLD